LPRLLLCFAEDRAHEQTLAMNTAA